MKVDSVKKLKSGDIDSFEEVYDKFSQKIYQFVFFKVNNKDKAEDICSEVFLRFVKFVKEGNKIDSISGVLYRIARNLIIDDSRKNKEDLVGDENLGSIKDDDFDIDDKYINNENLFSALSDLSDDYRDVIVMSYIDEMNIRDVADVFGKTVGATKTMLSRAMDKMREILKTKN